MKILTKTIYTNGLNLNVVDTGTGDVNLIFLHYWGGSSRTWSLVASNLSGKYRCILPDLRGWGNSDKSADDYSLTIQADDVLEIVRSLSLKNFVLIGHSMGGKIAQIIAARRPSELKALVLVAPAPPTPMAVPVEQRQLMLDSYQSRAGVEGALSVLTERVLSPELRQQVIDDTLCGAAAAKRAWTEEGMIFDISTIVGAINVPVTVIVGDKDRVENEAVLRREIGGRVSSTTFFVLPGVGHLSPLEAPEEIASLILEKLNSLNLD